MVEGYWGHDRYSEGVEVYGSISDAPESLGLNICDSNVNEDEMYWGEAYTTGEPVLVKDGSVEFGNAAPANLLAYELFSDTSINVPDVGYSAERDQVFIEILDGYDGSLNALDTGEREELMKHVAAKALIGDSDFMHNIGRARDAYALIDPDQAGAPVRTFEDSIKGYLEAVNKGTSFEVGLDEFQDVMRRVSDEVGDESLESSLSSLEAFKHDIPDYANFEPEFIRNNFDVDDSFRIGGAAS